MAEANTFESPGYSERGERLVAGVVPISPDRAFVLLISSTRRGGWVLPKGGWELDESSAIEAAKREAWEEAGIVCHVQRDLGTIADQRSPTQMTNHAPQALYQFYEALVEKEEPSWPEAHKRSRAWMTYAQAAQALSTRPELLEALNRSSIAR
jgi:diphosphoinositol-polyphosphate diphosphatase